MKKLNALTALLLLSCSAGALAQTPNAAAAAAAPPAPPARGPAYALALEAAQSAIEACHARDQKVAVSVVDSAGVLKVLLAADGASARGVASSTNKAVTALTFNQPTSALGEHIKADKALADKVAANPSFNARAGGVVLTVAGTPIGAIGVGGARGSENDEACALAGIAKVAARLQ
ncbi:MAG: GlcG/HbpS family heme-binding protein [Gammaproteobacteria bacterium]